MKTIEYETVEKKTAEFEWRWNALGHRLRVALPGSTARWLQHERDIPADWPAELREAVRKEIQANRERAENEAWSGSALYTMRVEGGGIRFTWDGDRDGVLYNRGVLERLAKEGRELYIAALAYLNKHAPKLADNEVMVTGKIQELRWHGGEKEVRVRGYTGWDKWSPCCGVYEWKTRAEAWFAANKPLADNEALTDDGRRVTFVMDDDGEAEALRSDGRVPYMLTSGRARGARSRNPASQPTLDRLLAFRDAERAKWTFEHTWSECLGEHVQVRRCKEGMGWFNRDGYSCPSLVPTWVRKKAEALWNENRPKKPAPVVFECRARTPFPLKDGDWLTMASCGPADAELWSKFTGKLLKVTIEVVGDKS